VDHSLLAKLESAIRARNPAVADSLLPGLPESEIRNILNSVKAAGELTALLLLYMWHNGISSPPLASLSDSAFLPGTGYRFLSLQDAAEQFATLATVAHVLIELTGDPTHLAKDARWFFPVFWDGATGYLAVDLRPSRGNGIVIIEVESEKPFRQASETFEDFIAEMLRANEENDTLTCFHFR
jgi:hypothetical protein